MKVFLDTKVLVSAFTARSLCADLGRYLVAEHEVMTGGVNLVELRRVLAQHLHTSIHPLDVVEDQLRATGAIEPAHGPDRAQTVRCAERRDRGVSRFSHPRLRRPLCRRLRSGAR